MKILLYGESHKYGTGAWCYAQAILEMGIELATFDDSFFLEKYKTNLLYKIIRRLNKRLILKKDRKKHVTALIELGSTEKPDIIIILKGINIDKNSVNSLCRVCPFVVNLNHDDFFSLNKNNRSRIQFQSVPAYDFIFVTREQNIQEIKPFNSNVELLMFAYSTFLHRLPELSPEDKIKYKTDVLFVGTYERNRAEFLEKAQQIKPFNLSIYGQGWNKLSKSSLLRSCLKNNDGIWGDELAKAIRAAKITLGFLRKENRDNYTQRSFEIPACGGILLAEDTLFHRKLFLEYREAMFFDINNPESLRDKIEELILNGELCQTLRQEGHKKVIETANSYQDRIRLILDKYSLFKRNLSS